MGDAHVHVSRLTSLPPHVARPHPWLVKNNKRTSQASRIHGKDRVLVLAGGVSSSLSRTHSDVVSALHSVSWASTNSIHLLRRLGRKTGAFTPFLSSHRPLSPPVLHPMRKGRHWVLVVSTSPLSCSRCSLSNRSSSLPTSSVLVSRRFPPVLTPVLDHQRKFTWHHRRWYCGGRHIHNHGWYESITFLIVTSHLDSH